MNLNQLTYFVTLAQIENYTRAAKRLDITQPSLSHAISNLEKELQVPLFERHGRNVTMTKYGEMFLKYVQDSLHILNLGVERIQEAARIPGGSISIGYIHTQGRRFIPELVRGFLNEQEGKKIDFRFQNAATGSLIRGLKEELGQYPQVTFTPASGLYFVIRELFEKEGLSPETAFEVEEDGALAGMVAEEFGVGIVPDVPVIHTLPVKILNIENLHCRRYIYMGMMKNRYPSALVEQFRDYIYKHYRIYEVIQ